MDNKNSSVEIDLFLLLRKLWSRKFMITFVIVFFATVSLLINVFLMIPEYTSTTSIYVVNQRHSENTITTQDLQAGDYLVRDYKEIINSKDVLTTVVNIEGLDATVDELREKVTVSIPANTRIIYISVEDENPNKAAELANAVREVASEKIKQITKVDEVNVVEIAEPSDSPSSPKLKRNIILGALVGGFLAVVSILIRELLDDRIKRPEDIEEVLGMTLLGIVPSIDKL